MQVTYNTCKHSDRPDGASRQCQDSGDVGEPLRRIRDVYISCTNIKSPTVSTLGWLSRAREEDWRIGDIVRVNEKHLERIYKIEDDYAFTERI